MDHDIELPTTGPIPRTPTETRRIWKIDVRALFGRYDYTIGPPIPPSATDPGVFILYGDNGCGKTTCLKLAYHLLAHGENRGHKTFVLNTPFSRLRVTFVDGSFVEAVRDHGEFEGPCLFTVERPGRDGATWLFAGDPHRPPLTREDDGPYRRFLTSIRGLDTSFHFLGDDRRLVSDTFDDSETQHLNPRRDAHVGLGLREQPDPRDQALGLTTDRVAMWLYRQAIEDGRRGESSANTLLLELVTRLLVHPPTDAFGDASELSGIISELSQIESTTREYSRFGLAASLDLSTALVKAQSQSSQVPRALLEVLRSYKTTIETRLDAYAGLFLKLSTFQSTLNSFLHDKRVALHVRRGLHIRSAGRTLEVESLSSGEKQLLLLACNTLIASDRPTIFFIDEPELSLNVKWQRKLVDALLAISAGSPVQFVLATHSIQIIAGYADQIYEMTTEAGPRVAPE